MREVSGSELLFPFGFDLSDDFADRFARGVSSGVRRMRLERWSRSSVSRVRYPSCSQLPEQVVERLFAHAGMGRELRRALVLGAGVLEHVEVRGDQVGVAALVQAGEHPVAHGLERDPQQRADQRRRVAFGSSG